MPVGDFISSAHIRDVEFCIIEGRLPLAVAMTKLSINSRVASLRLAAI